MQTITGNTYPVRAQLKALGGTWNKTAQGWNVPDERADEACAIVAAAGPDKRAARPVRTRFASGATTYRNPKGRCEDAPCCDCCS